MRTCYKRCNYCAKTMSRWTASKRRGREDKTGVCRECEAARRTVEEYWPNQEPTRERIKGVREHFDKQNRMWDGRPPTEKLNRRILRETKKHLNDAFQGRCVRLKWGHHETEGMVDRVRIHHGQIVYCLEGRDEGIARHALDEFEVLEA